MTTTVTATKIRTAAGEELTTEAGEDRCYDAEETAAIEVQVPAGTVCDICGETIEESSPFASEATVNAVADEFARQMARIEEAEQQGALTEHERMAEYRISARAIIAVMQSNGKGSLS